MMGVALRWPAGWLVLAVVCASPLILEILWPAGLAMTPTLAFSFGAVLGYGVQTGCCRDADYLFLRGVTRPQLLASAWVRVAVVGLLFWIDWAIALRASTGVVTPQQAEVLVLAFGISLLAASLTKPGSWAQSQGKKAPLGWFLKYWSYIYLIPFCVLQVLVNHDLVKQRHPGRDDLYVFSTCLLVLAVILLLCARITLRAWKRSDLGLST